MSKKSLLKRKENDFMNHIGSTCVVRPLAALCSLLFQVRCNFMQTFYKHFVG